MPGKSRLSVEIFRDAHGADPDSLPIEPLLQSVANVGRIVGKFDVLDATRTLKITRRASSRINMDGHFINTEDIPADINVVLTDRDLTWEGKWLFGVAQMLPSRRAIGTRIAIVTTSDNHLLSATGDHEIGHTLNLPHCDDDECTMSVRYLPKHEDYDEDYAGIYCTGCTDKIVKNTDTIRRAKIGKKVSKRVLFPTFYRQYPDDPLFRSK